MARKWVLALALVGLVQGLEAQSLVLKGQAAARKEELWDLLESRLFTNRNDLKANRNQRAVDLCGNLVARELAKANPDRPWMLACYEGMEELDGKFSPSQSNEYAELSLMVGDCKKASRRAADPLLADLAKRLMTDGWPTKTASEATIAYLTKDNYAALGRVKDPGLLKVLLPLVASPVLNTGQAFWLEQLPAGFQPAWLKLAKGDPAFWAERWAEAWSARNPQQVERSADNHARYTTEPLAGDLIKLALTALEGTPATFTAVDFTKPVWQRPGFKIIAAKAKALTGSGATLQVDLARASITAPDLSDFDAQESFRRGSQSYLDGTIGSVTTARPALIKFLTAYLNDFKGWLALPPAPNTEILKPRIQLLLQKADAGTLANDYQGAMELLDACISAHQDWDQAFTDKHGTNYAQGSRRFSEHVVKKSGGEITAQLNQLANAFQPIREDARRIRHLLKDVEALEWKRPWVAAKCRLS